MKQLLLIFLLCSPGFLMAQKDPYLLKEIRIGDEVNTVCYFPDGNRILIGLFDGTAKVIELSSGKTELSFKEHWKGIMDVDVASNGKFFMTAGDNTIKIWDLNGNEISRLPDHTTTIYSADIDPSDKYLVSGAINKVFKYWDIMSGKVIYNMKGHTDVAMAVSFSHNGRFIASGSGDHTIKIWEAGTDKEVMTLNAHGQDIYDVAFSPDDTLLASCSKDKTIRIYDLKKGELYKILTGHKNFVMDVEFAPDGLHLVSCSFDKEIRIWEIPTAKCLYSFIDHNAEITDLAFAPDGKSFASASYDKTIKIWNYTPDIFVDYYYSAEIAEEMNSDDIFSSRKNGESKSDFEHRQSLAMKKKKEIYDKYYLKYLEKLKKEHE